MDLACGAGLAIELARARGARHRPHRHPLRPGFRRFHHLRTRPCIDWPAYEAIQSVGREAFYAVRAAGERIGAGLPLGAPIVVGGHLARAAGTTSKGGDR